jgi:hypothetical protein
MYEANNQEAVFATARGEGAERRKGCNFEAACAAAHQPATVPTNALFFEAAYPAAHRRHEASRFEIFF